MRNSIKLAIGAAGLMAVTVAQAANYAPGDLLVGFDGGANNLVYDLGQASSLTSGQSWTISAPSGSTRFGIVGYDSANNIYATWGSQSGDLSNIGFDPTSLYSVAAGNIRSIAGGTSAIQAGGFRTTTSSDTTGWFMQTDQPAGTPGNYFFNNYLNPNVGSSATAFLIAGNNGGALTDLGSFTFNGGLLTYTAVPEPTTFSLVGGFGILAVMLRRRLGNA